MGIAGVLSNYQAEDGAGPMIAEQLAMNPFAVVIQSDAIKGTNGGVRALATAMLPLHCSAITIVLEFVCLQHGMVCIHTFYEDLYKRMWVRAEIAPQPLALLLLIPVVTCVSRAVRPRGEQLCLPSLLVCAVV